MPKADRGSVWIVDLGFAGKNRAALILNGPLQPTDRALYTIVPATTSLVGTRHEIAINPRFLKKRRAFDVQQIQTISSAKLMHRVGDLTSQEFALIETAVRAWLGL